MDAIPLEMSQNTIQQFQKLKRFVFTDPVAFRYLVEDPTTVVLERNGIIDGYELYLVEQWACSRVHPTFIITTYTGDVNHKAVVGVLGVPADEESWSPRIRFYFKATSQFYARLQETSLGMLMITNLNSFPSTLTVIPVPEGDIKRHREYFLVNENLKRLGCSGRSGMSLAPPAGATQAKFLQLYKTSQRVQLSDAVIELVKLCQLALIIFGKLEQEYADGFLCDLTENAVDEWWAEIGSEHLNAEPTDGILGPTTVAGLLGMLIGARNRLSYCGAPVAKDAFDLHSLKRGIEYFQKSQKLKRTRRLDRLTLGRLRKVTAKAAAGDGWAVPKAVKSTVVELSGKGGEMVRGIVGRDKAGISDIETLDIDHFISLAQGERTKWLWHGKPRRGVAIENHGRSNESQGLQHFRDEQPGHIWSYSKSEAGPTEDESEIRWKEEKSSVFIYSPNPPGSSISIPESPSDRDHLHKTVLRSVTGKMSDAKNGFGRIKDAVGLRGHANKQSKDEGIFNNYTHQSFSLSPNASAPVVSQPVCKALSWKEAPMQYQDVSPKFKEPTRRLSQFGGPNSEASYSDYQQNPPNTLIPEEPSRAENETKCVAEPKELWWDRVANEISVPVVKDGSETGRPVLEAERDLKQNEHCLRRRSSIPGGVDTLERPRSAYWWPRHMSFGEVEDIVFLNPPIYQHSRNRSEYHMQLQSQWYKAENLNQLCRNLIELQNVTKPWVEKQVQGVQKLDEQLYLDHQSFQEIYLQLTEQYKIIKQHSQEVIGSERTHLMEAIREIEILGARLEYEINAFVSKVQDVEDGVTQLQRQVDDLEGRADELEMQMKTESWARWVVRTILGIITWS